MLESFLQSIAENPDDQSLYLILADWLEERDDPRGELTRLQYALRQPGIETNSRKKAYRERQAREVRMRQLVAAGVQPCLPSLTNNIGMKLTLIPAGAFRLGSPDSEPQREGYEGPQKEVTISRAFYLGVYPVTQREYKAITKQTPSEFRGKVGGPDHPVERVGWADAVTFCDRLTELKKEQASARRYRLPTEAEWEYACRAGTTTPFWWGVSISSSEANIRGDYPYGGGAKAPGLHRTSKVGSFQANPFGLYDVHGNVWEWCQDWCAEDAYATGEACDPQGPKTGSERVLRGGCWRAHGWCCRSASRNEVDPDVHGPVYGFRVVLSVPSPTTSRG